MTFILGKSNILRRESSFLLAFRDNFYLCLSLKALLRNSLLMQAGEDKYVIFISGLGVGSSSSNPLKFQLLVDHITGHLGDEKVYIIMLSYCTPL